jgi:hypothetical protein
VVTHGETAEIFKVIGEVPGKTIVFADAAFLVNGGDE